MRFPIRLAPASDSAPDTHLHITLGPSSYPDLCSQKPFSWPISRNRDNSPSHPLGHGLPGVATGFGYWPSHSFQKEWTHVPVRPGNKHCAPALPTALSLVTQTLNPLPPSMLTLNP